MAEAAQGAEGNGFLEAGFCGGFDFEAPPVVFPPVMEQLGGFLAGDKGTPRHRAARAVPVGAGEGKKLGDGFPGGGVEDDIGGAAQLGIAAFRTRVVAEGGIQALRIAAVVRERTVAFHIDGKLVVADEDDLSIRAGKGSHAVRFSGNLEAIRHFPAFFRKDAVGETFREIDDSLGVFEEWAEAFSSGF